MKRLPLFTVLLMTSLLTACSNGPSWLGGGSRLPEGGVPILRQVSGNDSGLRTGMVRLVNSRADFEVTGASMDLISQVDFSKESVILIAMGSKPTGGHWTRITGVQQKGDDVFVQGLANRPGMGELTTQAETFPYALAVVQRVRGNLRPEIESVEGQAPPVQ